MRAEFDSADYSLYLLRYYDRYWGGEAAGPDDWSLEMEEESIEEARARMNEDEKATDQQWEAGRS